MQRLITFTRARIGEDIQAAKAASKHFSVEATSHMTSPIHAAFVRMYGPEWVVLECARKLAQIAIEESQDAMLRDGGLDITYGFYGTRILAIAWRDHADFEDSWLPDSTGTHPM